MKYQIKKTQSGRKKNQGLALLEILIAIGILGLIAAGVATLASRTFEERNANAVSSNVVDMALSIQKAYQRAGEYTPTTGNTVQDLVNGNVIPKAVGTNPVTSAYYTFYPAKRIAAGDDNAFTLGIDGLSQSLCTTLVTGGLLDEAAFVEVVATGTAHANKVLNVAANWAGATATGVVKSIVGRAAAIDDPTTATLVCGNAANKIVVGFY